MDTIDFNRYSRQAYSIGKESQSKLSNSSILVIGYNTLSQEIIRNLTLMGVHSIDVDFSSSPYTDLYKETLYYPVSISLSDNYEQTLNYYRALNPMVHLSVFPPQPYTTDTLSKFQCVILTENSHKKAFEINQITHGTSTLFIMGGTFGLVGYILNDFGPRFIVDDTTTETFEPLYFKSVTKISDTQYELTFKEPHGLYANNTMCVQTANFVVKRKIDSWRLVVEPIFNSNEEQNTNPIIDYTELFVTPNVTYVRNKNSFEMVFEPVTENYNPSVQFTQIDYSVDISRIELLHKIHRVLDNYVQIYGKKPRPWSQTDFNTFIKLFNKHFIENDMITETNIKFIQKIIYTCSGCLLPFVSVIGGILSHEVLKGITNKTIPINQYTYIDYVNILTDEYVDLYQNIGTSAPNLLTNFTFKTKNWMGNNCTNKYEGFVNIFGKEFLREYQNTCPFVVGSGAIGCELLKNLGMSGVKCTYISDPDYIEKSNLTRQFLFNEHDLRQSKSETASKKIKIFNEDVNIISFKSKLCAETENIFNKTFYDGIDIILNGLDNDDARRYMDEKAIEFGKPLIDSGTMGSKANVQVVIPYLTESYGSTKDPEEKKNIPMCTIKSFPYKPAHVIQWARDLFEAEFAILPSMIKKYSKRLEKTGSPGLNEGEIGVFLKQVYKYNNFTLEPKSFIHVLSSIFWENIVFGVQSVLNNLTPNDSDKNLPTDPDIMFNNEHWTETFGDIINEYFKLGFCIMNQVFGTNFCYEYTNTCPDYNGLKTLGCYVHKLWDETDQDKCVEDILKGFIGTNIAISNIEFDKDDDSLKHIDWITFVSNIRNEQYNIPKTDIFTTRKIAGTIIPAIITTTALVAGIQMMEFIRIIMLKGYASKYYGNNSQDDIDKYYNRFINLDVNYCDGINPVKSRKIVLDNYTFDIWTCLTVDKTMLSTEHIIKQIETQTNTKVDFIEQGTTTLFDGTDILIPNANDHEKLLVMFEGIDDTVFNVKIC